MLTTVFFINYLEVTIFIIIIMLTDLNCNNKKTIIA